MQIPSTFNLLQSSLPSRQGKDLILKIFKGQTSVGPCIGLLKEKNLVALGLISNDFSAEEVQKDLCNRPAWRRATFTYAELAPRQIEALEVYGTPFQLKVWQALYDLPRHETTTYKKIAHQVGYTHGFQAIGQAISRNPISLWIPCHLVLEQSGAIGNYYWGKSLKKLLLEKIPQI